MVNEDNNKKSITIKQGTGDEIIEMTINVTQEELEKMEQIRNSNPEKWIEKDWSCSKRPEKT